MTPAMNYAGSYLAKKSGFDPRFQTALDQFLAAAPAGMLSIRSGYRTPERQAQLWQGALQKYGSAEAARKWVAPPGRSNHNHGLAADLGFAGPDAIKWAHENAPEYGLAFPLSNENWHVELAGIRGGNGPAPAPAPQGGAPVQIPTLAANFASQPMGMAVDPVALAPPPVIENPLLTRAALQEKAERGQAEIQQRRQALLGGSLASTFA